MVRAGILRAVIGTVMACLDQGDWRGNRASAGQILDLMNKDAALVNVFPEPGQSAEAGAGALENAKNVYSALVRSDLFERGKQLRNDAVAHKLIGVETRPVHYEAIYSLHDTAMQLATDLYQACYRGTPQFVRQAATLSEHAKVFCDSYFVGMQQIAAHR